MNTKMPSLSAVIVAIVPMLVAQASTPAAANAQGVRLDLVAFVVRPGLDHRSGQVFERLGRFRAGIGFDAGIGYDVRQFGATLSAGVAGLEIGEPITRDGIGMGRETGIYSSTALVGHWLPRYFAGRWHPSLSVGYVRSSLNNVLLAGDSLPEFARSLGGDPPDSVRRPVGVSGSGARLGVSFQRWISAQDFSGRMEMNVSATLDAMMFRRVTYDRRRAPIPDPAFAMIPRLSVALRWSPRAASDPRM